MTKNIICKNCYSETSGKFCDSCGQRTVINKVTFSETFQDIINGLFSIDAPMLVTIKTLILNPGKLFRDFLSGKRKTYYKPVSFFILTTIAFVLVKALLNYDPMQNIAQAQHESLDISLFNKAGVFMAENINNIIFTFVFSLAIMTKVFFYKKYALAEYVAVSFYMVGFYIIITTLMMFVLKFISPKYKMLPFILMFVYVLYALLSFFQRKNFLTVFKIFLVYFFSILLYMIFGYGISFLIVWLKSL